MSTKTRRSALPYWHGESLTESLERDAKVLQKGSQSRLAYETETRQIKVSKRGTRTIIVGRPPAPGGNRIPTLPDGDSRAVTCSGRTDEADGGS